MKMKNLNFKLFGLFLMYLLIAVLSRVFYTHFGFDKIYLDFLAGLITPPMIFYLIVCFDTNKHTFKYFLFFIAGYLLFQFIIREVLDKYYIAISLGIIFSSLLVLITFIRRINHWFLGEDSKTKSN